jgi:hypothetical protein
VFSVAIVNDVLSDVSVVPNDILGFGESILPLVVVMFSEKVFAPANVCPPVVTTPDCVALAFKIPIV